MPRPRQVSAQKAPSYQCQLLRSFQINLLLQGILEQRTLVTHLIQLFIRIALSNLVFGELRILLIASPQQELEKKTSHNTCGSKRQ